MRHKTLRSVISALIAVCLVIGILPVAVFASEKPELNLVTIGASNVNGYGLRGYLKDPTGSLDDDEVMEAAALNELYKKNANVLGYNQTPEGCYPMLLATALGEQGYDVTLSQLAISSMRAEELHILLDDSYNGDVYSGWRFIGNGKWFDIADGTADGDYSQLRNNYQNAVANADVITVDIGANNFGVYLSYMVGNNDTEANNINNIGVDPRIKEMYAAIKAEIENLLNKYNVPQGGIFNSLLDTLSYALVGYCYHFDKSMERIFELNPDATVVAVSIQNMLSGLKGKFGDIEIPLGEIVGALINTANVYIAVGSPYSSKYLFADVRQNGRVEFFIDQIARYESLDDLTNELIDCFDVWDGSPGAAYADGMHIKYMLAGLIGIENLSTPQGQNSLNNAYDAYAKMLSAFAKLDTIDISALFISNDIRRGIGSILVEAMQNQLIGALTSDPVGSFSFDSDAFFTYLATEIKSYENVPGYEALKVFSVEQIKSMTETIAAMGVRTDIGNSFFSHPTLEGHKEIRNAVLTTLAFGTTGEDVIAKEIMIAGENYYNAAKNGDTNTLDEIVDFIAEKGYIDEAQAEVIKAQLPMIYVAVYEQNDETALASCKKLAVMIYDYARANGYISDEVEEALIEAYKVYDELKDKTPEELKEIAKENIIALAEKYGPEVLEKVNEYILGLDVLDERQLGELEAKIAAYINEYYDDPEAGVKAAVNDIVDFVFEITEIDRDTVAAIYDYVTTTSKEEMIEDAAELLKEYLEAYGPAALEAVENYLISEGYVTADEIAAVTKQIGYAVAAYEAQDNAAVEASLNTLAKMVYDYADANGYIPAEVKEAVAAAIELYNKYGDLTPEEIKALVAAELQKFIAENKAAALIALETYIVNEGWMSEADLQELAQKIAAAIAAYEADPEGTTDKLVKELVDYVYAKAIEEGYIDPAQAEELVDLFNAAYEYYVNTPAEQIKADAINLLVSELDKHLEGKVDPEVYAQVKADIFALINYLETSTPEEIQADIDAFVADLVAKYEELIYNATHGKFIPNGESYYVALGSGTAYGLGIGRGDKGYFDLIVDALGLDAATQFKNLADPTLDTTKILEYIVKNAAEIQKADVITYQLDATAFVYAALSEEQPDWSKYFNTEDFAFIDEAIPVIKSILADDWTKYADIDAAQIVNDIKEQVLNSIDSAVMDAFKDQTDKLDELLSVCVAQVKSYVEYVQENAIELYKAILNDIARVNEAMAPVVEVINDNWASYADLDVEDIVDSVKDEVLAQLKGLKVLTEEKVNEIITVIVEKAVALHKHVAEQIAKIPGYFSEEQLAFAEVVYSYVADYVIKNYPELTEIDVEGNVNAIHVKAYSEIMDILRSADEFNYEQYVELGADEIKEVLNTCEDIVMAAIDAVQDKAITALETVENAQAVVAEALNFIAEYLFTDWSSYVDMGVEEICNTIKDAFIAELANQSAYGEQYVDEYADKITAVLTLCVEEVKAVLQNVQDVKEEALDIINTVEEYQTYINNVLYAAVAYAVDTAKAIEAIQTINPDAVLIVVGMYNPLDGFEVIVNNETINVGDYVDYLIDATNVYYTALAIADGEFIFVPVPDTEINGFTTPIDTKLINVNQLGMLLLGLNTKMYANAAGNEYIYEQIMDAVDTSDYEPDVDNRTKEEGGEFDAKVEFDEYFRTAYVTCDQACVVLAAQTDDEGETTYTRLVPQALEDGTYGFDLTGIEGKYVLVVALKGDYNLDGAVTTNDVAQANKAFVNGTEPSALQNYVFDMTGDDEITTNDVAKVNKAIVNETAIEW